MKLSEVTAKPRLKLSQVIGENTALVDGKPTPVKKRGLPLREFAIGGAPGFSVSPGAEDVLPAIGQTMGGKYGLMAAGGAAAGELARQGIKAVRGDASGFKEPLMLGLGSIGLPKAVPSVGREAATSLTLEGITRGLGRAAKPVANRLMNSIIKPSRKVLQRNPNLGVQAVEAGLTGTKQGILKKAGTLIAKSESELDSLIKGSKDEVDVLTIAANMDNLKRGYANIGDDAAIKAIEEVQDALLKQSPTGKISVSQANQLKRDFYSALKNSQFGTSEVPAKVTARKAAAGQIKRAIEAVVSEAKGINKRMGTGIEVRDAIEGQIAQGQRNVILPKLAGMGAGAAALTGNPLTGAGILLGDRAVDLLRSAPMVSGFAKNLLRTKKYGRPLTLAAAEMARRIQRG